MKVTYKIEDEILEFEFVGNTQFGKEEVLLKNDINLLQYTPWNEVGYVIQKFTTPENFELIVKGITKKIKCIIEEVGGKTDENFTLERYHKYVDDESHLNIAKLIQFGWHVSEFPIEFDIINERLSNILGIEVSAEAKHIDFYNYNYSIRIARPNKVKDNNPPHRDVWLDRLRNAVNIYVPLCGSTIKSSLPLIPGSHLLKESEILRTSDGAYLNETKYTVPCVVTVKNEIPQLIRPNPKENEVMVFSPYLVHGGGYNLNDDQTRMSLEIRFWKTEPQSERKF